MGYVKMEESKSFNPIRSVWTELYRPKKIDDIVGNFKHKIAKYMENPKAMPHFLFHSRTPGTGKTTLAKVMINELNCDSLILNSSDDRKIDVVREKVKDFAITQGSNPNVKKCIFLDEFDGMLKASQDALRNIMETYASNCFFILTANNINKIIEPLKSRCVLIPFAYPNKGEVRAYLANICRAEKMEYTDEALDLLIEMNYPSIRNCVVALQDLYTEGLGVNKDTVRPINKMFEDLWKVLLEKDWKEIKKVIMETTVDARELNKFFWEKAITQEPVNNRLIQILCRNEKDISWGSDSKIIFVTSLIELVK